MELAWRTLAVMTVAEAARKLGKDPETVRRWIRSGRLHARRLGTRYLIDDADLETQLDDQELPVPKAWQRMANGRPMPNVVRPIRLSRGTNGDP
jgi:excisionase family DNA binding protein